MCKNVFYMLTKEQIPIDLKICINDISQSWYDNILNPIFEKYFHHYKGFKHDREYKAPIWNKYCKVIASASTVTTFEFAIEKEDFLWPWLDDYEHTVTILHFQNAQQA